jgi:hypothetical protein
MVAGFKSECRPASSRNTWPECIGICNQSADQGVVFHKSLVELRAAYMPDAARAGFRVPPS